MAIDGFLSGLTFAFLTQTWCKSWPIFARWLNGILNLKVRLVCFSISEPVYFLLESCRLKTATLPVFHLPNCVLVSAWQWVRERIFLPFHFCRSASSDCKNSVCFINRWSFLHYKRALLLVSDGICFWEAIKVQSHLPFVLWNFADEVFSIGINMISNFAMHISQFKLTNRKLLGLKLTSVWAVNVIEEKLLVIMPSRGDCC